MWGKGRVLDANRRVQAVLEVPVAVHAGVGGQEHFTEGKMEVCKQSDCLSTGSVKVATKHLLPWLSKAPAAD